MTIRPRVSPTQTGGERLRMGSLCPASLLTVQAQHQRVCIESGQLFCLRLRRRASGALRSLAVHRWMFSSGPQAPPPIHPLPVCCLATYVGLAAGWWAPRSPLSHECLLPRPAQLCRAPRLHAHLLPCRTSSLLSSRCFPSSLYPNPGAVERVAEHACNTNTGLQVGGMATSTNRCYRTIWWNIVIRVTAAPPMGSR